MERAAGDSLSAIHVRCGPLLPCAQHVLRRKRLRSPTQRQSNSPSHLLIQGAAQRTSFGELRAHGVQHLGIGGHGGEVHQPGLPAKAALGCEAVHARLRGRRRRSSCSCRGAVGGGRARRQRAAAAEAGGRGAAARGVALRLGRHAMGVWGVSEKLIQSTYRRLQMELPSNVHEGGEAADHCGVAGALSPWCHRDNEP